MTTWHGFVYVAFVIDVFVRRIVGWRVFASLKTDFVLDALEQAIHARCGTTVAGLVHHSDRGMQYPSMHYTVRLADEGSAPLVGSREDSYVALAESVIGLFKPRSFTVAAPDARWSAWNSRRKNGWTVQYTRRLLEPIGYVRPAE